jgi:hypothetical protein
VAVQAMAAAPVTVVAAMAVVVTAAAMAAAKILNAIRSVPS